MSEDRITERSFDLPSNTKHEVRCNGEMITILQDIEGEEFMTTKDAEIYLGTPGKPLTQYMMYEVIEEQNLESFTLRGEGNRVYRSLKALEKARAALYKGQVRSPGVPKRRKEIKEEEEV